MRPAAIPHRRWAIGVLLGSGILINYFDRISLSVAAPRLQHEFGLNDAQIGLLFSVFFWSYALSQIPVGMILDRFGVTRIGRLGGVLWSAATGLTALAGGFGGIIAARIVLGVAEAPAFPANAKATGYWFPQTERGRATAIFDAAAKFSNVIGAPLMALAVVHLGWRGAFWCLAGLNFIFFVGFFLVYRDPSADRRLSPEEYAHIRAGGGATEGAAASGSGSMLGYLLRARRVWGLTIGFAAYGYSFALLLTWLPNYLVDTMHMSLLHSAEYTAIPWGAATVTDLLVGGWLIDYLILRGKDPTRVRKAVLVIGMLVGLAVFGAVFTTNARMAILWITIALGGLAAAAPVGWSIPALIAPRGAAGTVGGIMNFVNNLMGAAAPVVTGFVVGATHSFSGAFVIAGFALVIGILSYVFLMGPIEPIPEPGSAASLAAAGAPPSTLEP